MRFLPFLILFAIRTAAALVPDPNDPRTYGFQNMKVFEAVPPYYITQADSSKLRIPLAYYDVNNKTEYTRRFDFVAPLVNPTTNHSNLLSLQAPVPVADSINFLILGDYSAIPLTNNGSPKRTFFDPLQKELTVAYRAWDPPSGEKARVQLNTFPVITRREMTYDLSFKLGGNLLGEEWPMTKTSLSPKLLWQIKADPGFPSMALIVDTDYNDPTSIRLSFVRRLENIAAVAQRYEVGGLKPNQFIDVSIQATLDDRDGNGHVKLWVNGKLLVYYFGRTLIKGMGPHRMAFGLYLMNEPNSLPFDVVSIWRAARVLDWTNK